MIGVIDRDGSQGVAGKAGRKGTAPARTGTISRHGPVWQAWARMPRSLVSCVLGAQCSGTRPRRGMHTCRWHSASARSISQGCTASLPRSCKRALDEIPDARPRPATVLAPTPQSPIQPVPLFVRHALLSRNAAMQPSQPPVYRVNAPHS